MEDYKDLTAIVWPLTIALSWVAGEIGHARFDLPRISIYSLVAFLLILFMPTVLITNNETSLLLAHIAFGLILFEFGYRVNLSWLQRNPWLTCAGVAESAATYAATYAVVRWIGADLVIASLLASLSMATSPVGVMRVVNEQNSAGQVTERIMHLTVINCVLSLLIFKATLGYWVFQTSDSFTHAAYISLITLAASGVLGAVFGVFMPWLLQFLHSDGTVAFALAVIVIVSVAIYLNISPIFATLSFGLTARHRRIALSRTQRDFGALGNILTVILYCYVVTAIHWNNLLDGLQLGLLLVAIRIAVKTACVTLFAQLSGISWKKGLLTGLALTPISVFGILLFEQTKQVDVPLLDSLAAFAAMMVILEIVGPIMTQAALVAAKETTKEE